MKRFVILILMIAATGVAAFGQITVKGSVCDNSENMLRGVTVRLCRYGSENTIKYVITDSKGEFTFKNDTLNYPVKLRITSRNYAPKEVIVDGKELPIRIQLQNKSFRLKEVVVKAPHTRLKGDTIVYDVNSFKGNGDRSIEDVIKKLPGITVDKSGTIYYDDKQISNFYIEGMNLMGGNYMVASKNISPDDISSISVYERHQAKRALKGVKEEDRAALNLTLRKGRMLRPIGYVEGGSGYGDNVIWNGGFYGMLVSPKNQTIISAKGNNAGNSYKILSDDGGGSKAYGVFDMMPFGKPSLEPYRYIDNKSAYFTANSLFKAKNGLTFTANTFYSLEHGRYDGHSMTEYLNPDGASYNYTQDALSSLHQHIAEASMKIEKNLDSFYLLDRLYFKGTFNDNSYGISGTRNLRQCLSGNNFNIGNSFNTIIRRGSKIYDITSVTWLRNTPVNNIRAFSEENGSKLMSQYMKGLSFHNNEKTSFAWMIGRNHQVGIGISFSADYDRIHSLGSGEITSHENYLEGYNLDTEVSPYYKFSVSGRFSATISLPVNLHNIRYTDIVDDKIYRHNNPYFNPRLSFMYRPSRSIYLTLGAGRNYTLGDIRNFIDNPIFTTFRTSSTLGSGSLYKSRKDAVNIQAVYRNPASGFNATLSGGWSRTRNNSISVFDVKDDGESASSSVLTDTKTHDSFTALFSLTKRFVEWNTMFGINGNGMWRNRNAVRSGKMIRENSGFYSIGVKGETSQFNNILTVETDANYSLMNQKFGGLMESVSLDNWSFNGSVSIFPLSFLEIYGEAKFLRSELVGGIYKNNLFIDAGIRAKVRKFEISVSGINLTNRRNYEYAVYSSLDVVNYSYSLRPIQGLISIRYSF